MILYPPMLGNGSGSGSFSTSNLKFTETDVSAELVALIRTVPGLIPVTLPVWSTVAISSLLEVHFTD